MFNSHYSPRSILVTGKDEVGDAQLTTTMAPAGSKHMQMAAPSPCSEAGSLRKQARVQPPPTISLDIYTGVQFVLALALPGIESKFQGFICGAHNRATACTLISHI